MFAVKTSDSPELGKESDQIIGSSAPRESVTILLNPTCVLVFMAQEKSQKAASDKEASGILDVETMTIFCKKKGFVYKTSEIYGGAAGFWDFGPLGAELNNTVKRTWWKRFVQDRDDVVGMDGAIISHPKVWEASGHAANFADIVLTCSKCNFKARADQLIESTLGLKCDGWKSAQINKCVADNHMKCPECKSPFNEAKDFNLMFETTIGPVKSAENTAFLRPETAQHIFSNFKIICDTARVKLPFGIAQVGKAFRNEISPRDFLFRKREFELMEIEFFVHPDKIKDCPIFAEVKDLEIGILTSEAQEAGKDCVHVKTIDVISQKYTTQWHAYWLGAILKWFINDLGIKPENLRLREHLKSELAHYASACFDIEYKFPFGWKEVHGNADRTTYDLTQHMKFSKTDLSYFDEETKMKVVPYVASEPSQGVDRAFLAVMFDAYHDDKARGNIVLRLKPSIAPVQVAVFPLVNKLDAGARTMYRDLKTCFPSQFDRSGSVGRRYARADEIGVPYCVTYDFESETDKTVTIRDRDTTLQIRVPIAGLKTILADLIAGRAEFSTAGKKIEAKQE